MGKHHFWLFPNLTEDVGVIESFKPLYKHDIYPPPELEKELEKQKSSKKKSKEIEEEEEDGEKNDGFEMIASKSDDTNDERTGDDRTADERTGDESVEEK